MPDTLNTRLEEMAQAGTLSDRTPCRVIAVADVKRLADESCISGRLVEIAALRQYIIPDRYLRNMNTLSEADQIRLLGSTVCIVGMGGLGGLVTETLARMGVGRFHLIDGDVFEAHNLNRQLFCDINRIGMLKVDAAVMGVQRINPGLETVATAAYLTPENVDELVGPSTLVVDCLDNIPSRFTLAAAAKRAGIPMISAAVAGISGHVTTLFPEDNGLEAIYGYEDRVSMTKGVETRLGCLAPGVNLMASLECAEVLKVLLKKETTLKNRLLVVDLADYTFESLQLS